MTKALQLARSFHARRAPRGAGRVARSTGSPATGSRARSTPSTACPTRTTPGYAEALLDDRAPRAASTSSCRCRSPAASVPRRARRRELLDGVLRGPARRPRHACEMLDDKARVRRAPRRRSGCRCPTRHRITDPAAGRSTSTSRPGAPYILKSIAYNPVGRLDLTPLPRPTPRRRRRLRRVAADLRGRPVDPAGVRATGRSTARTARCATGALQVLRLLRVVGVPGQLRDGRPARDPALGRAVRRGAAAHRPGVVRLHRVRRTARSTRSSATRAPTRRSPCSTTTRGWPHAYLDDGASGRSRRCDRRAPDVLALPRAVAAADTAATRRGRIARSAGQGRDLRLAGPVAVLHGAPRSRSRRCCSRNLRARRGWIRIDFNIGKLVETGGRLTTAGCCTWSGPRSSDFHADLSRLYAGGCLRRARRRTTRCRSPTSRRAAAWRFPADAGPRRSRPRRRWRSRKRSSTSTSSDFDVDGPADVLPAGHDVLPRAVRRAGHPVRRQLADVMATRRRQGQDEGDRRGRRGGGPAR